MRSLVDKIIPFIVLGVTIVVILGGMILFAYLLLFGAIVGVVLFIISKIRAKFFPSKKMATRQEPPRTGRTFENGE